MDIPKMKIVIYILTFLGYAYTGYGANIICQLRDAVLLAKDNLGDFLSNVATVARKFRSVSELIEPSLDENCVFTCPNGGRAVSNKNHKPSFNGCSTDKLRVSEEYMPTDQVLRYMPLKEVTNCCNEHDICYDTCNSDKEKCDFAMRRCLYKICEQHEPQVGDIITKGCKVLAKTWFTATMTLGCKPYLDAQKEACFCQSKYRKYAATGGEEL